MKNKFTLEGIGTASNAEINIAASDIFDILRIFDSPKDAASALVLAHIQFIKASFPPEYKDGAIVAIDAEAELVKTIILEGYQ